MGGGQRQGGMHLTGGGEDPIRGEFLRVGFLSGEDVQRFAAGQAIDPFARAVEVLEGSGTEVYGEEGEQVDRESMAICWKAPDQQGNARASQQGEEEDGEEQLARGVEGGHYRQGL